jgi:hypothetical protein
MHTEGGGGKGEGKYRTRQANFKTLVTKNAIRPKIGGPPRQFFLKALTRLGILAKTLATLSLDFQTNYNKAVESNENNISINSQSQSHSIIS